MRRIGGTTIRSVGHIGRRQSMADDNDEFVPAAEMLDHLLKDNRHVAERRTHNRTLKHRGGVRNGKLRAVKDETRSPR